LLALLQQYEETIQSLTNKCNDYERQIQALQDVYQQETGSTTKYSKRESQTSIVSVNGKRKTILPPPRQSVIEHLKDNDSKMAESMSQLDPGLFEQVRQELIHDNAELKKQISQMQDELMKMRQQLQSKTEQLQQQKEKTEAAEMESGKILIQQQSANEKIKNLEQEMKRYQQEKIEAVNLMTHHKTENEDLRTKLEDIQKETERKITKIRAEEAQRAEAFIQEAKEQIAKLRQHEQLNLQNNNQNKLNNSSNNTPNSSQHDLFGKQKNDQQRQYWEQKMQELERKTIGEFEILRLEQMKLQQSLQTKVEEYIQLKLKLSEREDQLRQLNYIVREKDRILQRQSDELQAFGHLKLQSDQIHNERYEQAQETILKLNEQLKKLQMLNEKEVSHTTYADMGYPEPKSNVQSVLALKKSKLFLFLYVAVAVKLNHHQVIQIKLQFHLLHSHRVRIKQNLTLRTCHHQHIIHSLLVRTDIVQYLLVATLVAIKKIKILIVLLIILLVILILILILIIILLIVLPTIYQPKMKMAQKLLTYYLHQ